MPTKAVIPIRAIRPIAHYLIRSTGCRLRAVDVSEEASRFDRRTVKPLPYQWRGLLAP